MAAALLLPAGLTAQIQVPEYVPMKIIQTEPVIFPHTARDLGITSGEAQVAVQIDESGKLTDYLVTAYTYPAFADAAVVALKEWEFKPAYLRGEPRSATADLSFKFESRGLVVVDLNVSSYVEQRNYQLHPGIYAFHACTLRELDRIPTPTKVVKPVYPRNFADKDVTVTVQFYIDEQGHVRLPAVSRAIGVAHDSLSAAAVQAVQSWEFEPPLCRGRPVVVSARQDFNFRAAPK
jgi:TonB family protein